MSAIFNDDFYENHLDKWVRQRFNGNHEKIKKAIKDLVIKEDIKMSASITWPSLFEAALERGYITQKEAYCDE